MFQIHVDQYNSFQDKHKQYDCLQCVPIDILHEKSEGFKYD